MSYGVVFVTLVIFEKLTQWIFFCFVSHFCFDNHKIIDVVHLAAEQLHYYCGHKLLKLRLIS